MKEEGLIVRAWPMDPLPAGVTAWPITVVHLPYVGFRSVHAITDLHLQLVVRGERRFCCSAGEFKLEAGDMYCVFPGDHVDSGGTLEDDPFEFYGSRIIGPNKADVGKALGFSAEAPVRRPDNTEVILHAFRQLFAYWGLKDRDSHMGISLFHHLISDAVPKDHAPSRGRSDRDIVSEACTLIDNLVQTGLNVNDLASQLNVPRNTLWRIFREATGTTVTQYIQQTRIEHAKMVLSHTGIKLSAVANMCGFGTEQHFYYAFRQHTGMTPTRWRKENALPAIRETESN